MTLMLPAFVGAPAVNKVYNVSAMELLKAMPDNSVDCVVTSPPYDNLRTYNGYSFEFEPIARETYRVLKPGGVCVWVVGDSVVNGSETLTSMRQALYFVDVCGFRMHDTMIYEKQGTGHPDQTRYDQVFEYMFIFSKGSPKTINLQKMPSRWAGHKSFGKKSSREKDGRLEQYGVQVVSPTRTQPNIWKFTVGFGYATDYLEAYEHPAIFPDALAERHILTWTNPGDLVVDYFGGSGTTASQARKLGRDFLTCDTSLEYCDLMRKRLAQPYTPNMFIQHELEASLS